MSPPCWLSSFFVLDVHHSMAVPKHSSIFFPFNVPMKIPVLHGKTRTVWQCEPGKDHIILLFTGCFCNVLFMNNAGSGANKFTTWANSVTIPPQIPCVSSALVFKSNQWSPFLHILNGQQCKFLWSMVLSKCKKQWQCNNLIDGKILACQQWSNVWNACNLPSNSVP